MAQPSPTEQRIRGWLKSLADATQSGPEGVSAERIATMAAMLAYDPMPAAAYCGASLKAAARGLTWFPSYAQVHEAVENWWGSNRPREGLALPDHATGLRLSVQDRHWLAYWRKRLAENFGATADHPASNREHVASLIQQHAPDAWAAIIGIPRRTGTRPPAEDELAHVDRLLAPVRDSFHPESQAHRPPLPDVSLKDEALARARTARGLSPPPTETAEPLPHAV